MERRCLMLRKNLFQVSLGVILLGVLLSSGLLFAQPAFAVSADKPTIAEGSNGQAVTDWQQQLNQINSPDCYPYINLGPGLQTDGRFGPKTLAATKAFQLGASNQTTLFPSVETKVEQANGGPINLLDASGNPDGIVGPLTHKAMDALLSVQTC